MFGKASENSLICVLQNHVSHCQRYIAKHLILPLFNRNINSGKPLVLMLPGESLNVIVKLGLAATKGLSIMPLFERLDDDFCQGTRGSPFEC